MAVQPDAQSHSLENTREKRKFVCVDLGRVAKSDFAVRCRLDDSEEDCASRFRLELQAGQSRQMRQRVHENQSVAPVTLNRPEWTSTIV